MASTSTNAANNNVAAGVNSLAGGDAVKRPKLESDEEGVDPLDDPGRFKDVGGAFKRSISEDFERGPKKKLLSLEGHGELSPEVAGSNPESPKIGGAFRPWSRPQSAEGDLVNGNGPKDNTIPETLPKYKGKGGINEQFRSQVYTTFCRSVKKKNMSIETVVQTEPYQITA